MAENKHASDGVAEDKIRSLIQLACVEQHIKTRIEKQTSLIDNGIVEEVKVIEVSKFVMELENELVEVTQLRRETMLDLYNMFGQKGDKEEWCSVKHYAVAMYTAFEVYQASTDAKDMELYMDINTLFIRSMARFLGVEVTSCASCFGDMLKAQEKG